MYIFNNQKIHALQKYQVYSLRTFDEKSEEIFLVMEVPVYSYDFKYITGTFPGMEMYPVLKRFPITETHSIDNFFAGGITRRRVSFL